MPSSLPAPSLIAATRYLIGLRVHITRRTLERSPAAQTAGLLALLLVCPAAMQIGKRAAHLMGTGFPEAFAAICAALLLLTLLYVALLLAGNGGLGGVVERLPESVLRALPVPPGATLLTDVFCFAASLPTLFFLLAAFPLMSRWQNLIPLALLAVFAVASALLLGRTGMWIAKRGRTSLVLATIAILLLGGVLLRAAPAAALSSVLADKDARPPVRLPWDPPLPPPSAVPAFLRGTPPGLAAQSLHHPARAALPLLALGGMVALACAGTVVLDRASRHFESTSDAGPIRATRTVRTVDPFRTEVRLLLRNPSAHTLLRGPASLLLTIGYAWMSPNLGGDAVRSLVDLLGIGVTLYVVLWQLQFVCNRFGADAGFAATLFLLPVPRARLLVTKNAALLTLMLAVDAAFVTGFALVAKIPHLLPTLLLSLPVLLVLLTALGNVVSVLAPFPLPRKMERYEREPDRSLLFVYALVGAGVWLSFLPAWMLWNTWGIPGYLAGVIYAGVLYTVSIALSARLLTPLRERRMIALLDGIK